jgi:AbrB family looped-hinge helix DNA binding protein
MKLVRMSTKGRVTIPRELREELGLKPGDRVVFTKTENGILLQLLRGTLLDHRGSLEVDGEQDFERIRREVFKGKGKRCRR